MGIVERPDCVHCGDNLDDVCHTFFVCGEWEGDRRSLEATVGPVTPDNLIELMPSSEERWIAVAKHMKGLLRRKKRLEEEVAGYS